MKSTNVRKLTNTALLLALCIAVQQLKQFSQFITGPIVNIILIIAALYVGIWSGLTIAALSPIFALLIAPPALPQIIPVIMLGNAAIVLAVWLFKNKYTPLGLVIGAAVKALILWGGALLVVQFFSQALPPEKQAKIVSVFVATFSYNQLITALIGGFVAYPIWLQLKKIKGDK